jgi:hypothetical protein
MTETKKEVRELEKRLNIAGKYKPIESPINKIKVWTDKEGNKLTIKDFLKRWKEGLEGLTPLQKIKSQIAGTRMMLIGFFLGLFVTLYGWKNLWWVTIILIGAIINTGVQYIGLKQQKKIFDDLENGCKGVQDG